MIDGPLIAGMMEDGIPLPLPQLSSGERGRVRGIPGYGKSVNSQGKRKY